MGSPAAAVSAESLTSGVITGPCCDASLSSRTACGTQMFEKLPSGYRLTAAGEEVFELAEQMEASSHQLETRVFGRDQSVRGLLRVTLAPTLATHLLIRPRRVWAAASGYKNGQTLWTHGGGTGAYARSLAARYAS